MQEMHKRSHSTTSQTCQPLDLLLVDVVDTARTIRVLGRKRQQRSAPDIFDVDKPIKGWEAVHSC